MAQAKVKRLTEDRPRTATLGPCVYVGEFHELSSETYRQYKLASRRFADIAERQAKGE